MAKERSMEALFPILEIEGNALVSKMGDLTLAYELVLPEIFTSSEQDFEDFHQAWVRALRLLPKHSILHKQDWFLESVFRAEFRPDPNSFMSQSSDRHFHERPFLDHRCFLLLSKCVEPKRIVNSLFSNLIKPNLVPRNILEDDYAERFRECCQQFVNILQETGLCRIRDMRHDELESTLNQAGLLERYCTLSSGNDPLLLRDIDLSNDIRIGGKEVGCYTLGDAESLPSLCASRMNYDKYSTDRSKFSVGFASHLGQLLPCNHLYNQYIFLEDAEQTLKKMEGKRLRLQSLAAYSRQNLIARDATNAFLNEAFALQHQAVKAHFNILIWSEEEQQLKKAKQLLSSSLASMDCRIKEETVGAAQIFWAGIPGNAGSFPMNECFDTFTNQASCFLNLETGYRSSISPVGIRLGDRLSGKPLHVDISDEPMEMGICTNRNKFILGPSGSGKSFFTNHMVRTYFEQGCHVVLVDVGHSYQGLCELVGGYYFTYTEDNPIRFNPFYLGQGDQPDTEKKESIKTLLLALWKKDDEAFRRSEYVALSNAISGFYEYLALKDGIFPCFDSFYEYLHGTFRQTVARDRVKRQDFDIDNFLYVLRPYYAGGEFDYLLNGQDKLDMLHERFIVFELDNIKDHPILFPVVTIIIMEVFISKLRKMKGVRKMILIEEAWKALMKEGFAEYIKYLFKTVRKYFGEAVVVTQEVDDIISSPVVKQAIINNSDCKILLDQSKYQNRFDQIQELLGLTEKEKAQVLSLNRANDPNLKYKEVFISLAGVISKVYRTEVSKEEYLVYTTEEREKFRLRSYMDAQHGDVQSAVKAMVKDIIQ
ncbi:TraG family conjugative transposon ATPase [Sphingobacterium sp.]|uniref:TraG family conjugative transposon ATPase n=1 Tax=Sphingobacterium sp. TaxID=341027 RepID=UPI0028AAA561|nr:TraG family conjugative transposon ATPase [Sphingobacterium sp.]